MRPQRRFFPKSYLYVTLVLQIIAWQFAIALVILLGAQGYSGLDGGSPISATCTPAYFISKYSAIRPMLQTTFLCSLIAVIGLTVSFVVMLLWVIRVCSEGGPAAHAKQSTKILLYVTGNIIVLTAIPPCGYYLTQLVELNNCTATYSFTQLMVIFLISALLLLSALVYLIFILLSIIRTPSDAVYRDVSSHPTEPQQHHYAPSSQPADSHNKAHQRNGQNSRGSPSRQPGTRNENGQHTKENLFDQNEKGKEPKIVYNYKERDPQQQYGSNKRQAQEGDAHSKYLPPESQHYISPKKRSQANNSRLNKKIDEDDDEFQVERSRYMNKMHGGSILPSRALEQKSPYDRKTPASSNSDAYRNYKNTPPQRIDREAVLISHIRGKYAN